MSGGLVGRVERLLELDQKRTPGPWIARFVPESNSIPAGWHLWSDSVETLADFGDADSAERDAEYVAAAVNEIVPLARDWERMREALEEIAHPQRSEWMPGEWPLVIMRMQEIASAALAAASSPTPAHKPDCVCHTCDPYEEWTAEDAPASGKETTDA